MMLARTVNDDLLRRKRELRMRIGRSRRRINGRLRATRDRARQLVSWRTYIVRYPGRALIAALGAGFAASAGLRPGRISRRLGLSLVHQAFGGIQSQLWAELKRIWTTNDESR
jgi:hypothetical protein